MRITVLGATGGIGRAIVEDLAARDHMVTAASRSVREADLPPGVVAAPTDLLDPDQARAACASADVVVMAAQVPYASWATQLGVLVDAALDAADAVGARLVWVDNLYAYGAPDGAISVAAPEDAATRKGRLRAELGQRLLAAHQQGRARVSIGRFSDYYGAHGSNSLVNQLMLTPALAGRTARTYLDADQPHTFAYLPDAARAFATLAERPDGDGRAWVLPAAPAITQRELLTLVEIAVGAPIKRGHVSRGMLRLLGVVNPQLREALELTEQWTRPYLTDAAAFEDQFGPFAATSHRDAIAAAVEARRADTASARTPA
jgi:nucleoside-diphosphate-sugar epimerase